MPGDPLGQFISDYTSLGGYSVRNTKRAAVIPVNLFKISTIVLVDFGQ